jgi:excisionase family DNA binding protein
MKENMGTILLKPKDVAAIFGVSPKTVTLWANAGKLPYVKTPGGTRRYPADGVKRLYEASASK